jgi:hypothetical protein
VKTARGRGNAAATKGFLWKTSHHAVAREIQSRAAEQAPEVADFRLESSGNGSKQRKDLRGKPGAFGQSPFRRSERGPCSADGIVAQFSELGAARVDVFRGGTPRAARTARRAVPRSRRNAWSSQPERADAYFIAAPMTRRAKTVR